MLPTSNIWERLFSGSGYALINGGKEVLPSKFEVLLFRYMNRQVWGVDKVRELENNTTIREVERSCQ